MQAAGSVKKQALPVHSPKKLLADFYFILV